MNKLKYKMLFILWIGLFSSTAILAEDGLDAELINAGELLQSCEEGYVVGSPNQYCMRYVFGLVQTIIALQQAQQSAPLFCINPQVIRLEAVTDVVIEHLRQQAARTKEDAQTVVLEALHQHYPCDLVNN